MTGFTLAYAVMHGLWRSATEKSGYATRFTDHYHTCRAGTIVLLAYVHGAKVHIFSLAPPKTTQLFCVTH